MELPSPARDSVALLVTSLAGRLNRGATNFYQQQFAIGMAEFRVVMALGLAHGLNIGELAVRAEVDQAAASRALRHLHERGLVQLEQTVSRGRAAIAKLTAEGQSFAGALREAANLREQRLTAALAPGERELAVRLLGQLMAGVPVMNAV